MIEKCLVQGAIQVWVHLGASPPAFQGPRSRQEGGIYWLVIPETMWEKEK